MTEWVLANWEWIMLGFYTLEKIVKLSPSKKDDIIFDAVIKPVCLYFLKISTSSAVLKCNTCNLKFGRRI